MAFFEGTTEITDSANRFALLASSAVTEIEPLVVDEPSACGWMADKIKRSFLGADSLWQFLKGAVSLGNKLQVFRDLNSGQVELLASLDLAVNQDIKSRVTYSVVTRRLSDDARREFIHRELDRLGLAHGTFTSGATELIIRLADGVLRRCRNLCLSAMLEAVRASAGRTIDIDVVNRVLLQPHWQNQVDLTDF